MILNKNKLTPANKEIIQHFIQLVTCEIEPVETFFVEQSENEEELKEIFGTTQECIVEYYEGVFIEKYNLTEDFFEKYQDVEEIKSLKNELLRNKDYQEEKKNQIIIKHIEKILEEIPEDQKEEKIKLEQRLKEYKEKLK